MGEIIDNGAGDGGFSAKVDLFQRLWTNSVSEPEDKFQNHRGKQWSLYFTATPVGASDYFFYLENTGTTDIAITDIRTMCASADTILIERVSGTPVYASNGNAGTAAGVQNKNLGKTDALQATAISDTNTTGLTNLGTVYFQRLDTANKMDKLSTSANIIIPQGSKLALKATTGTALITCVISIVELLIDGVE